ncbi:MAG: Lrp/AsnC family transcriptional regulator [Ktedonobacterales bacterium]
MNDEIDKKIVMILQQNARISNADIARQLDMAPSAIFERIRKLEARGTIKGYAARIDPVALDRSLLAFVFVRAEEKLACLETGEELARIPEVQEVHHVAGEDCYLVKVRVANTDALGRLLRERFGVIPTVHSTRTTIVLTTIKETATLPITPEYEETPNAASA